MLDALFPRQFDNRFKGRVAAVWLFALVVLAKLAIGLNSMLNGYAVALNADGVPMTSFAPDAVRQIVSMFALLGLLHVTMAVLGVIVLLWYRAMIPLIFALLLLERLGRQAILTWLPGPPGPPHPPGATVSLVLIAAMALGMALSLWQRRRG